MTSWLFIVPVWGERCVNTFIKAGLPALRYAAHKLDEHRRCRLVAYTDAGDEIKAAAGGLPVEIRPVPQTTDPNPVIIAAQCHRDAIGRATFQQRLLLLTADMVVSGSTVASCEERLTSWNKKIVMCAAMRVNDSRLPTAAQFYNGRELLIWGWANRHAMTRESTWPDGHSYDIWRMYFERGDNVNCRLALPHPIALMVDKRRIKFNPTIDVNLVSNYNPKEIHLVTNPDELAAIELSPPDKDFLLTESMKDRRDKRLPSMPSFVRVSHPRMRRFLSERIIIKGSGGDCGEGEVLARMMDGQ